MTVAFSARAGVHRLYDIASKVTQSYFVISVLHNLVGAR